MIGIYRIVNTSNGKCYVGQSINIEQRLNSHLSNLQEGTHQRHLQSAYNKYGAESFVTEVLEECSRDDLNDRERFWISYYNSNNPNNGYNMTSGGESSPGWQQNQEVKDKISERLSGDNNPMKNHSTALKCGATQKQKRIDAISKGLSYGITSDNCYMKGKIWIHKGNHNKTIDPKDLQLFISDGWSEGQYKSSGKKKFRIVTSSSNDANTKPRTIKSFITKAHKPIRYLPIKKVWITDGTTNKLVDSTNKMPDGFYAGRTLSNSAKIGTVFINNGVVNKQIPKSDLETYISNGWILGMIRPSTVKSWVNNESKSFLINAIDIDNYLSCGYILGRHYAKRNRSSKGGD